MSTTTEPIYAKAPAGDGWTIVDPLRGFWRRGPLVVRSEYLARCELPRGGIGPTWLVSVSVNGKRRATDAQLAIVRRAFDMVEAEEDNHHPGVTRCLFLVVDPARRVACECKVDEATVVDPADGFTWTTPKDGPCRGCELERLYESGGRVRPCPIHGGRR